MAKHEEEKREGHLGGRHHSGGRHHGGLSRGHMGKKIHGMGARMGRHHGGSDIEGPHEKELSHK